MFKVWRKIVIWFRSLLVALWLNKNPIRWVEKIDELLGIVVEAIDKAPNKPVVKPDAVKPDAVKPITPENYDIIGPKPRRRLRDLLKGR